MTDAELKRLSRTELLEMLLGLEQENDQLRRENDELRKKMQAREIMLTEADSIAEASSAFTAPA